MSETSAGRGPAELASGDPAIGANVVALKGTAAAVTRLVWPEILLEPELSVQVVWKQLAPLLLELPQQPDHAGDGPVPRGVVSHPAVIQFLSRKIIS
jgi:hypothetical protein